MTVKRERISSILELREILLSFQTSFSLVNATAGLTSTDKGLYWPAIPLYEILHISYKDHVTNEKVQQAIRPHEDLLTIIKRRKLQWYGHVSHPSGLAKTILQGTVKGGRRQGRQRKRWEDSIRNGQAWSSPSPRGKWSTGKNEGNWLQNHLSCPNDPRS